jgi:hypothetical protein
MNKLQEKSDAHKIDLELLNNFLLEKGDNMLEMLLIRKYIIPLDLKKIKIYLSIDGWLLQDIPEKHKTYELCKIAVTKTGNAILHVPENLIDYNLCEIAVLQNGRSLDYVPYKFKDYNLCEKAVSNYGHAIQYVPKELIDYFLCEKAVSTHGQSLMYIPKKFIDYPLCEKAVSNDGWAFQHVPEKFIDYSLVKSTYQYSIEAIKQNWFPKEYIPQLIKDFPEHREFLENSLLQEYISKEVRKLLKETLFTKKKLL